MPSSPRSLSVAHEPPAAHTPSAARAPAPPHVPASITTTDLQAELNRRHNGEDSRITIKQQRERHYNIEGHNLEEEFDSLAPA
jgi:hypothetical protein